MYLHTDPAATHAQEKATPRVLSLNDSRYFCTRANHDDVGRFGGGARIRRQYACV